MGEWTSMSVVESVQAQGKQALFAPSLVYALNWVARNSWPSKFTYAGCHVCLKSMERGR